MDWKLRERRVSALAFFANTIANKWSNDTMSAITFLLFAGEFRFINTRLK